MLKSQSLYILHAKRVYSQSHLALVEHVICRDLSGTRHHMQVVLLSLVNYFSGT